MRLERFESKVGGSLKETRTCLVRGDTLWMLTKLAIASGFVIMISLQHKLAHHPSTCPGSILPPPINENIITKT